MKTLGIWMNDLDEFVHITRTYTHYMIQPFVMLEDKDKFYKMKTAYSIINESRVNRPIFCLDRGDKEKIQEIFVKHNKDNKFYGEENTFEIKVPTETPHGKPIKTVGVFMTGGTDSSFLLYMVCKYIKENNLNIKVQPYTIRKSFQINVPKRSVEVSLKIRELLYAEFMLPPIVYYPPHNTSKHKGYSDNMVFPDITNLNFTNGNIEVIFGGVTENPPKEEQTKFLTGFSGDEFIRSTSVEKFIESCEFLSSGVEKYRINPLVRINKRDLKLLYEKEDIMDTIFPITVSCTYDGDEKDGIIIEGHCGKCWWCEERLWGFERLE